MALRLFSIALPLFALLAFACGGGGSGEPDGTATAEFTDLSIRLERSGCGFGSCPDYSVTVEGSGRVTYQGEDNVAVYGQQLATISVDNVHRLVDKLEDIDYFSLPEEYDCTITDTPDYTTTVSLDHRDKTISHCAATADYTDAPRGLFALEDLIDEVTNSAQWVGEP